MYSSYLSVLYLQTPALLQVVHSMDEMTNILHSSVLTYQALSIAVQFPSRLSRLTVMLPATGSLKIPVTTTRPFQATALGCLTFTGSLEAQMMAASSCSFCPRPSGPSEACMPERSTRFPYIHLAHR